MLGLLSKGAKQFLFYTEKRLLFIRLEASLVNGILKYKLFHKFKYYDYTDTFIIILE